MLKLTLYPSSEQSLSPLLKQLPVSVFIFITLVSWRLPDNMLSFSESNLFVVSEQYSVVRCGHLKVGQNSSGNSWDLR